ncbi:hypothetical protein OHA72_07130 [Dactylosporangium sp. NBC_01737]|uniref:DUF6880 family protein n=1 Tax=Dactylosporangium sp. NBC_01737 TaxID=2975959 RepID=UPI002E1300AD|nr:DUF6880 family protein [Dactylosporangium sp. NBC_01737]WSG43328.1 hypothetical protein OHA72_07130 [Dactylosporangium sp. NBC_01737]
MQIQMPSGSVDDLAGLVDRLRRDRRTDPYRGRQEYSHAARDLTDRCEALIDAGEAVTVVPVLRKAADRMTTALMYMDDSSGIVGDDLQRIMDLYARACVAAPPNPKRLASWLVKVECDGPGWPRILLRDFAPALGASGLVEVEHLVAERAETADPESWSGQFAIRGLREQLAEVSGDVDRYVQVLAEHLASAVQYARIVDALCSAGRLVEAAAWARRGLAEKVGWPHTDELRNTLVGLLLEEGQIEEALEMRRADFERNPTLASYRAWVSTSAQAGVADPTSAAVERLRRRATEQPAYMTELVDILVATGAHDEAWTVGKADPNRLGRQRWLTLLAQRSSVDPADVIEPYQDLVEVQVRDSGDKHRYRRALPLISALQAVCRAAGQDDRFAAYLIDFRERHRRRPTLIKTLDGAGFGA